MLVFAEDQDHVKPLPLVMEAMGWPWLQHGASEKELQISPPILPKAAVVWNAKVVVPGENTGLQAQIMLLQLKLRAMASSRFDSKMRPLPSTWLNHSSMPLWLSLGKTAPWSSNSYQVCSEVGADNIM